MGAVEAPSFFQLTQNFKDFGRLDRRDRTMAKRRISEAEQPVALLDGLLGPLLVFQLGDELICDDLERVVRRRLQSLLFLPRLRRIDTIDQEPLCRVARDLRCGERDKRVWPEREKLLLAAEAVRKSPQLRPVRLNPQLETAAGGKLSKALARLSRAADDVRKRHRLLRYQHGDRRYQRQYQQTSRLAAEVVGLPLNIVGT